MNASVSESPVSIVSHWQFCKEKSVLSATIVDDEAEQNTVEVMALKL